MQHNSVHIDTQNTRFINMQQGCINNIDFFLSIKYLFPTQQRYRFSLSKTTYVFQNHEMVY